MTTLPTTFSEGEMVDEIAKMVKVVEDKMVFSYEWFFNTLCERLRDGSIDIQKVVDAADNNNDVIADAALRHVDAEMRDRGEERSITLSAYGIKAGKRRDPITRGRGQTWHNNFRRDLGIAVLIFMTVLRFGLHPTRNPEQKRRHEPSAASVVVAALRQRGAHPPSESRAQNIWLEKQGHIALYLLAETVPK